MPSSSVKSFFQLGLTAASFRLTRKTAIFCARHYWAIRCHTLAQKELAATGRFWIQDKAHIDLLFLGHKIDLRGQLLKAAAAQLALQIEQSLFDLSEREIDRTAKVQLYIEKVSGQSGDHHPCCKAVESIADPLCDKER